MFISPRDQDSSLLDTWSETGYQFDLELDTDEFANELLVDDDPHIDQPVHQLPETVPEQGQEQVAAQAGSTTPEQARDQVTSPGSPTTPEQAPSKSKATKEPGVFESQDIRGRSKTTMEDYHRSQKEKQDRAKARGRMEYSPTRADNPKRTPLSSTSSSSSSRSSSASSAKAKPSQAASYLPLASQTPAQPTPPGLQRTTRNVAYQGPPVDSEAYSKLKPLMPPPVTSRLGRKPDNSNIKSRLGRKSARDRLTPKATHTPQGPPAPTPSPAPTSPPSASPSDWMGPPAPSGKTQSKRVKRTP